MSARILLDALRENWGEMSKARRHFIKDIAMQNPTSCNGRQITGQRGAK